MAKAKRRRPGERPWAGPGAPRPASPRRLRVGELVRQALAEILARETVREPAVTGAAITVTAVELSPDLKLATCYVMPLGGRDAGEVVAGLERTAAWLGGQVARRVQLKFAPTLRFRLDPSFDEADRIAALLRRPEVAADLEVPAADSDRDEER